MNEKKMIREIAKAYGPSGREAEVSRVIRGLIEPWVDEVREDALGNLIAIKKGSSSKKIMVTAHMDQIGLIVTHIDENGFLRVSGVGGVHPQTASARAVRFENGVRGVTYFETEKRGFMNPSGVVMGELFIDIGAESQKEAQELVQIGDVAVYDTDFIDMGNRISCGALDNRICCAAVISAIQKMKTEHEVYAVFSVQEEVGLRGAGAAAWEIAPDLCINLDVTLFGDTPKPMLMPVKLGKGAAIKIMDASVIVPPIVYQFLEDVAQKEKIPCQREVMRAGGTDTGAVQRSGGGVLSGGISIPLRYVHSPVETADLRDFEAAVRLLAAALSQKELPHR